MSLELNHSVTTSPALERRRLPPALVEDDHQVSDVGLTITVSCRDQSSTGENEDISTDLEEVKADQEMQSGDNDDDEEEEESEEEESEEEEEEEEESDSPESSSVQKNDSSRLSKAKKYGKYSKESLAAAWAAINNDGVSVHMAAKIYRIPKSTLYDRVNNRNVFNLGGKPNAHKSKALDPNTERQMVEHIRLLQSSGYHVSKNEMLSLATKLGCATGRIDKKKELTRGWLLSFVERWPDLWSEDKPQPPKAINQVFPHNAVAYYDKLKFIMNQRNGAFHKKPHLIFSMDELVFIASRKSLSAVPEVKRRSQVTSSDNVIASLLVCGSAIGHIVPLFFIFRDGMPKETYADATTTHLTSTGLMDVSMFKLFLEDYFLENLCLGLADHVMLLYDRQTNYLNKDLIHWARERKIVLYPDPPHTCYSSKPLDFGCFVPFKSMFNSLCSQYIKDYHIDNDSLFQLAYSAVNKACTQTVLKQMFENGGIFPYDTSKLTKEHLLPYTFQSPSPGHESQTKMSTRKHKRLIRTGLGQGKEPMQEGKELCCACEKAEPPLNKSSVLDNSVIHWGQCSKCPHWVHLKHCSPVKAVTARSVFLCHHCTGLK